MLRLREWIVVTFAAWLAHAGVARAQPVERVAMSYVVPEGCPSEAEFVERLRARAPVVRIERGAQRTFDVGIEAVKDGLRGTLVIRSAEGALVREVDGETCEETVAALVVVAALAIEAQVTEPPRAPPPSVADASRAARRVSRERWLAVGSGLARYQGLAPDAMLGVPVFVAIGRARGARVRLAFARTEQMTASMPAGSSMFRWTAGRLDASPLRLVRGPLVVTPSIGIAAGVLDGHGTDVPMSAGGARPWVAPELALAIGVRAGRFALELEGVASTPLVRDRFFIAPSTTVHEIPWITTAVGVTLAVEVL